MSEPYIGEIRLFSGTFAPVGWLLCNGQSLSINDNSTLFTLIGTTYGGDGQTTFNLPNLLGRVALGQGAGPSTGTYTLGQNGGEERHTLAVTEIPPHQHAASATSNTATTITPGPSTMFGAVQRNNEKNVLGLYTTATGTNVLSMSVQAISAAGGSVAHENCMSTLPINYIICTDGIYPSQP